MPAEHRCVDCKAMESPPARPRPAPHGGPRSKRCYTHARDRLRTRRAKVHARYVGNTYGLPDGFYDALYEAQGGRCAWCGKASGKTKKLAVDHDHSCCPGSTSCGKCARGLLCAPCNTFLGYQMGDNPETIKRGARYLVEPPAQALLISWEGP